MSFCCTDSYSYEFLWLLIDLYDSLILTKKSVLTRTMLASYSLTVYLSHLLIYIHHLLGSLCDSS